MAYTNLDAFKFVGKYFEPDIVDFLNDDDLIHSDWPR